MCLQWPLIFWMAFNEVFKLICSDTLQYVPDIIWFMILFFKWQSWWRLIAFSYSRERQIFSMEKIASVSSHQHKFVEDNILLYRKQFFMKKKVCFSKIEVCYCKWKKQSKAERFLVRLDSPNWKHEASKLISLCSELSDCSFWHSMKFLGLIYLVLK